MKTRTFARLALLIPLLIWVILLLVELLIYAVVPADLISNESTTFFGLLAMFIMFYVLGILLWFLPYLILSLTLLVLSFKLRIETLQYLFLLSPFAMAILAMLEATIVSLPAWSLASPSTDLASNLKMGIGINLMMGILSLIFGYLCVGIGFGSYKILQRFGMIKEEEKTRVEIIPVNIPEV